MAGEAVSMQTNPKPHHGGGRKKSRSRSRSRSPGPHQQALQQDPTGFSVRPFVASVTKHPAVFANDSSVFFCTFYKHVLMYSTSTGEMLNTFQHTKEVVSIIAHPTRKEIITVVSNGDIYFWDINEVNIITTISTNVTVTAVAASRDLTKIYLLTTKGHIKAIDLTQEPFSTTLVAPNIKLELSKGIATDQTGQYVCVFAEKKLTLIDTSNDTARYINQHKYSSLTCFAIHPTFPVVAAGDSKGVILLWYFTSSSNAPSSKLHWHSSAVRSLTFMEEGLHLLSGGSEGTLVSWSIEQNKKSFVPRLGSPIENLSMDPSGKHIALCMKSNFIQLVDALSQKVVLKTFGVSVESDSLNVLMVDPYSKLLVVNGARGTLQFCDTQNGRANFELDIVSYANALTGANGELEIPQIIHATMSNSCITTVIEHSSEETLQFWDYNPITKELVLNTQLTSPHGKYHVTGLAQHPSRDLVVSFGNDTNFKFWLRDAEVKGKPRKFWKCRSVTGFRDLVPLGGTFSQDGSVLAVAHEHTVTLWDTSNLALRGTLFGWPETEKLKFVAFVSSSPHLVAVTEGGLYVWDLVSYNVLWAYNGVISSLAVDSNRSMFAVVEASVGGVLVFDSSSSSPVYAAPYPTLSRQGKLPVLTSFVSQIDDVDARPTVFVGIAGSILVATHSEPGQPPLPDRVVKAAEVKPTPTQKKSTPSSHVPTPQTETTTPSVPPAHTGNMALFDTPSHIIPPVSSLFTPFMESLVSKKQHTPTASVPPPTLPSTTPLPSTTTSTTTNTTNTKTTSTTDTNTNGAAYSKLGSVFKKRKGEPSQNESTPPKKAKTDTPTTPIPSSSSSSSSLPPSTSKLPVTPVANGKVGGSQKKKQLSPSPSLMEIDVNEGEGEGEKEKEKEKHPKTPATKSQKTPAKESEKGKEKETEEKTQGKTPKTPAKISGEEKRTEGEKEKEKAAKTPAGKTPAKVSAEEQGEEEKEKEKPAKNPSKPPSVTPAKPLSTPSVTPSKPPSTTPTKPLSTPAQTTRDDEDDDDDDDEPAEEVTTKKAKGDAPAATPKTKTPKRKAFGEDGEAREIMEKKLTASNAKGKPTKTPSKGEAAPQIPKTLTNTPAKRKKDEEAQ